MFFSKGKTRFTSINVLYIKKRDSGSKWRCRVKAVCQKSSPFACIPLTLFLTLPSSSSSSSSASSLSSSSSPQASF
ncbi:hypothetical protein Csa_014606 [Cucumis sativus]|uniref:Uncharacterized protein n=1 Tax=Cucumis sativus TaxID=3659 RepID=A0A0A0KZI2_CUCSA|nr:hypothetical protein Csa_014606 [Cucumis sativus]